MAVTNVFLPNLGGIDLMLGCRRAAAAIHARNLHFQDMEEVAIDPRP
jgi:hypothetical protein